MDNILCFMSNSMGFKTVDPSCTFYDGGEVHLPVHVSPRRHPNHVAAKEDERMWLPSDLHKATCLLQGLSGPFRSSGNGTFVKTSPKDQAHQHVLPSLLQTHSEGIN